MGTGKVSVVKDTDQSNAFIHHLLNDIEALKRMLDEGLFETGKQRIGAEQELCLISQSYRPAPVEMELLKALDDEHYTTEHAQFNLEINLDPIHFRKNCFSELERQLNQRIDRVRKAAEKLKSKPILVGILPTIRRTDLAIENLTPVQRYQALSDTMNNLKKGPYEFRINGTDELVTKHNSTMFEGSNTSFQVHLQVDPEQFAKLYNFAQLITAPVLAAATNSPILLGRRLWLETRIALFQQSVDTRVYDFHVSEKEPRVTFGNQWVKESVVEVYQDDISRYRVLLGADIEEDALKTLDNGEIPKLKALQVHNGTVYKWNRPCYGITNGKPHLRIENRVLPSGPTVKDEVANAAFWLGLMNSSWPSDYEKLPQIMDFDDTRSNFIKAARYGLDTQFKWIHGETIPADRLIIEDLLPMASEGLRKAGVDKKDIDTYLGVIEQRVETRQTGAQWILDSYNRLRKEGTKDEALVALTAGMLHRQKENKPVHTWSLPVIEEAGTWRNRYWRVEQFMTRDVFTVHEEDWIGYPANIMNWKFIRHVPVESEDGKLAGLLTARILLEHYGKSQDEKGRDKKVKEIMIKDPVTVRPDTLTIEAIQLMQEHHIGSLPVVKDGKLLGIVTEHDFMTIVGHLLNEYAQQANKER